MTLKNSFLIFCLSTLLIYSKIYSQNCCTFAPTPIQTFTQVTTNSGTVDFEGPQAIAFNPTNTCAAIADWNLADGPSYVYLAPVLANKTINNSMAISVNSPSGIFRKPVGLAFSIDGNWLFIVDAGAGTNGTVFIYKFNGCSTQPTYNSSVPVSSPAIGQAFGINFSPDGNCFVVLYNANPNPGRAVLYSFSSSANSVSVSQTDISAGIGQGTLESAAFSTDGKYVAVGVTTPVPASTSQAQFFPVNTVTGVFLNKTPVYI